MHLRVTTESDTYVYATSAMRIAGLDPEDFVIMLLPIALLNNFEVSPIVSLAVGIFCLWLFKTLTAHQPPGFLPVLVSSAVGQMLNHPIVQRTPFLRAIFTKAVRGLNSIWISAGLLPLPAYCNLYER